MGFKRRWVEFKPTYNVPLTRPGIIRDFPTFTGSTILPNADIYIYISMCVPLQDYSGVSDPGISHVLPMFLRLQVCGFVWIESPRRGASSSYLRLFMMCACAAPVNVISSGNMLLEFEFNERAFRFEQLFGPGIFFDIIRRVACCSPYLKSILCSTKRRKRRRWEDDVSASKDCHRPE